MSIHPDAAQILKQARQLGTKDRLADSDWEQFKALTDAAVCHAAESGKRQGKRESRQSRKSEHP